ncbi:helix-turn-helix domain-containing protein [Plantibacter sp. RU18]|uniref:helix-turn-helix domain-containing protein n=1 Tax=Plantibacter sp. RU18 TaxID=3158143 RepID=UPI003D36D697
MSEEQLIHVRLDVVLAERGMTLAELSRMVGVSPVNLSILKNGHARAIRFSTLRAICEALNCDVGDLLTCHPASMARVS